MPWFFVAGDDVVAHKHGEKSAQTLSAAGFRNLMFRTYNGYVNLPSYFLFNNFSFVMVHESYNRQCSLGHYTIPEETDELCTWLTASLGLEGSRSY